MKFLHQKLRPLFCLLTTALLLIAPLTEGYPRADTHEDQSLSNLQLTETEKRWIKEHPEVVFTGDPNWLPYEAFRSDGTYVGMVADHLHVISRRTGLRFKPVLVSNWTESLKIATEGKVSVISGDAADAVLNQRFMPVEAYSRNPIIIVMDYRQNFVENLEQIRDRRIAIIKGYGYTADIFRQYPEFEFIEVENIQEGLEGVAQGRFDALLATMALASYHIAEMGVYNVKIVGRTPIIMDLTLFVAKDQPILHSIIDKALQSISQMESQDIFRKWVRSRYIEKTDYRLLFEVTVVLLLIIGLFLFWNRKLTAEIHRRKQTEQALLENRTLLRHVVDEIPDILVLKDHVGDFLLCNQAAARLYNTTPEAMVGKNDEDFGVPKKMAEFFRQNVLDIMAAGKTEVVLEDSRDAATGKTRHFKSIKKPLKDATENDQILVIAHDITDIMHVQKELTQSEEKYRRLVDNLTEEYFFYKHDRDGIFTYVSPSMTKMLGWEPEEFQVDFSKRTADHPASLEVVEKTQLGLQGIRQPPYQMVTRHKDGSERWLEIVEYPIFDEHGNVLELEGIAHDFTDRKRMEETLQTSQRRLHETMQYASLGYWELLKNGLTANWSDEIYEIFDIEKSLSPGPDTLKELIHPDDRSCVLQSLECALNQGNEHRVDYRIRRTDGKERWVECRAQPVRGSNGAIEKISGFLQDITARKQAEAALRRSEERFRVVATATNDLIYEWDIAGDELHWYGDIDRALGYPPGGFSRTLSAWVAAIHPEDRSEVLTEVERVRDKGGSVDVSYRITTADGAWRTWCDTGQTLQNEDGQVITMIGGCKDVTDQRLAEEKVHHLAFHDSLTGLPNRLLFREEMQQTLERYRRNQEQFALHYLDLDHFKDINDSLGHHVGDELLRKVATRVKAITRGVDLFARLGGDEFGLIQTSVDDASQASVFAAKIIQELGREFQLQDRTVHINTSIGVVVPDGSQIDADDLLKKADTALYKAKDAGRGTYAFFHDSMTIKLQREMELVHYLASASSENQLFLEYQLQYDLTDQQLVGLEALIRWNHPERGLLMPGEFLPIAEKRGLIREISDWALSAACRQARQWYDNGCDFGRVAVNLCAMQVDSSDFFERIEAVLQSTGLDPMMLELEFTETVLMQASNSTKQAIQRLSDLGVKFAIDDFGTGFSSLSYLKNFHADKIKIDREFIRDLHQDPNDAEIVKATIALGVALGLDTLAEGVENSAQLEFLVSHGCKQAQGFYLGRPLSVHETTEILEKRTDHFVGGFRALGLPTLR